MERIFDSAILPESPYKRLHRWLCHLGDPQIYSLVLCRLRYE